ncbi:hypothetical protein AO268_09905 [Pseudomonas sp. ICMP 8385]|nr:hypothetical protein AO268_09905 [Pseudomonas sp. ICMP 8385]
MRINRMLKVCRLALHSGMGLEKQKYPPRFGDTPAMKKRGNGQGNQKSFRFIEFSILQHLYVAQCSIRLVVTICQTPAVSMCLLQRVMRTERGS